MVNIGEIQNLLSKELKGIVEVTEEIGSSVNHTYYCNFDNNQVIVKLMTRKPDDKHEHNRFLKTQWIYNRLKNQGVKVPDVIYCDNMIREFEDFTIYSILVLEKLEALPVDAIWEDIDESMKQEFATNFAKLLKLIHGIEFPYFDWINGEDMEMTSNHKKNTSWVEFLLTQARYFTRKLIKEGLVDKELLENGLEFLIQNKDELYYQGTPRLVHFDIWRGNFLWEFPDMITPLDWEWSLAGDPSLDLLWIESDIFYNESDDLKDLFYEVYGINHQSPEFNLKIRLLSTFTTLYSLAVGFVAHNPSEDKYRRMEGYLKHYIFEVPLE